MQKEWYVVNTYSGHENKVKEKLEMRANSMGMEDYIFRVIVPEQTEIEIKDGTKKEKLKKMFPGYILVEMIMTDEAWFVVRNTPGVTGFIGSSGKGAKPFPLTAAEVDKILSTMGISRLDIGNELNVDDMVKVINGPFASMFGKIKSINMESQTIEVALDLFGQETIVELGLAEITKS
jgi:transcriptional antiterminator NusG